MLTGLHSETLQNSQAPRELSRTRRDGSLRSTLLRELKMVTALRFEHLGGALEVEESWKC